MGSHSPATQSQHPQPGGSAAGRFEALLIVVADTACDCESRRADSAAAFRFTHPDRVGATLARRPTDAELITFQLEWETQH